MKLLVISPHPDDETLGAGGTILRHKDSGHKIYWLNITNMKKEFGFKKSVIDKRKKEVKKVLARYRFDGFYDLGLKPAGLDEYKRNHLVEKISTVFTEVKPHTIILPFRYDIHTDHRIAFESAFSCAKIFRHTYIKKVLMMEIISETDYAAGDSRFVPNCFFDISDYLDKKIEIAKLYEGEIAAHPFPRSEESIKALAVLRGAQAGCKYAEAFSVLKIVE